MFQGWIILLGRKHQSSSFCSRYHVETHKGTDWSDDLARATQILNQQVTFPAAKETDLCFALFYTISECSQG